MKLIPALELEKLREEENTWNKIVLHHDGKFYHAYEWSAWLIKTVTCSEDFQKERGDDKILSANRYLTKNNEYAMIGFPIESMSKYIPEYKDVRKMEEGDDMEIEIELNMEDDVTFDQLNKAFEEWKVSLPMKETKKVVRNATEGVSQAAILSRTGVFQIIAEIMAYPVERSTPADNINFISNMKQEIAKLL